MTLGNPTDLHRLATRMVLSEFEHRKTGVLGFGTEIHFIEPLRHNGHHE